MSVVYRPAATQDLAQACELVARSINDLSERHGFGQQAIVRPPDFQSFSLRDDPTGLWVAEQAGEIVGFGFSWSCGYLWFLAQLFVAPKCQGQGIGSVLLDRTLEHARTTGATTKALLTYTFNTVSTALYIRHGLYPRVPIYNVAVATERLKGFSARRERVCTALKESSSHLRRLAEIDITALGVSREKHHRFVLAETDLRGYAVEGDSGWLGYFYVAPDGQIGPLAVRDRAALGSAFRTAVAVAATNSSQRVSAFVSGMSDALPMAIDHGMRITCPMVFKSDQPFGSWDCYLPRNPGFL